jgi:hypothetical protein
MQAIGRKALQKGLISYDERRGFRGPVERITSPATGAFLLPKSIRCATCPNGGLPWSCPRRPMRLKSDCGPDARCGQGRG